MEKNKKNPELSKLLKDLFKKDSTVEKTVIKDLNGNILRTDKESTFHIQIGNHEFKIVCEHIEYTYHFRVFAEKGLYSPKLKIHSSEEQNTIKGSVTSETLILLKDFKPQGPWKEGDEIEDKSSLVIDFIKYLLAKKSCN